MDLTNLIQIGPFQTSFLELIAVFFGLSSVWLMKKENVLVFPFGIINVLIYVYICFETKLYAYAFINMFYFIMSVYGWYNWTHNKPDKKKLAITQCSKPEIIINLLVMGLFFFLIRFVLVRYTDSQLPNWDAFTSSVYLIAQWLVSIKKIENWVLWILGDFISIGLFAFQNLYFSSLQYLIFTIIAVLGFLEWRTKLMK